MTAGVLSSAESSAIASHRAMVGEALSAQGLAFGSQLFGAIQILLLVHAGVGRATDTYFLLFAAGQSTVNVWILGVVYPRQLAGSGRGWHQITKRAARIVLAALGVAVAYTLAIGYAPRTVLALALPLVVAAVATADATTSGVALACEGRPRGLAGVAAPANLLACVALITTLGQSSLTCCFVMSVGLAIGSVMTALLLRRTARPVIARRAEARTADSRWFVVTSVVGGVSPLVFQTALAVFPHGDLTTFSIAAKVGLALTGIGLNALLPLLLNRRSVDHALLDRIVWCSLLLALPGTAIALSLGVQGFLDSRVMAAMVAWALICPVTSITVRLVLLTGDQRFFRWTAVANVLFTVAAATVAVVDRSVVAVAVGYLSVEAAVTLLMLARVGKRAAAITVGLVAIITYAAVLLSTVAGVELTLGVGGAIVIWRGSVRRTNGHAAPATEHAGPATSTTAQRAGMPCG